MHLWLIYILWFSKWTPFGTILNKVHHFFLWPILSYNGQITHIHITPISILFMYNFWAIIDKFTLTHQPTWRASQTLLYSHRHFSIFTVYTVSSFVTLRVQTNCGWKKRRKYPFFSMVRDFECLNMLAEPKRPITKCHYLRNLWCFSNLLNNLNFDAPRCSTYGNVFGV